MIISTELCTSCNYDEAEPRGWVQKSWCFWTVVLEKILESSLDCKEMKPVNPKGNQPWIFIGRSAAEVEAPILWPPDAKNWLFGNDLHAGKDWRQKEKGVAEDEMVGWHHWHNGHEFEWTPVVGNGQGSLACCCPWGCKELDMTERLNWTELTVLSFSFWLTSHCTFVAANGIISFLRLSSITVYVCVR